MSSGMATVRISRQEGFQTFEIPYESGKTVLDALEYIYAQLHGSLGFRCHYRGGYCVGCVVEVDGQAVSACTTYISKDMTITPVAKGQVVRDLTTELKGVADRAG